MSTNNMAASWRQANDVIAPGWNRPKTWTLRHSASNHFPCWANSFDLNSLTRPDNQLEIQFSTLPSMPWFCTLPINLWCASYWAPINRHSWYGLCNAPSVYCRRRIRNVLVTVTVNDTVINRFIINNNNRFIATQNTVILTQPIQFPPP